LAEGDVRLPKSFGQAVPQRWPGGRKTAVTELVAWSLDQARVLMRLREPTECTDDSVAPQNGIDNMTTVSY